MLNSKFKGIKYQKIFKIFLQKILFLCLILFIAEIILQIISACRYLYFNNQYQSRLKRSVANNWYLGNENNKDIINDTYGIYLSYDPFLGWLPNPTKSKYIAVTNERIRQTSFNPIQTEGQKVELFLFGGSAMWGYMTDDDTTIPSQLANKLNNGFNFFQVTNYGQIAYNSTQELIYLTLLLRQGMKPKIVIFYDGCNELFFNHQNLKNQLVFYQNRIALKLGNMNQYFQKMHPTNLSLINVDLLKTLWEKAPVYLKTVYYPQQLLQKLTRNDIRSSVNPFEDKEQGLADKIIQNYTQNIQTIINLSKIYGFEYMFIWQPVLFTKAHLSPEEKKLDIYSPYHPEIIHQEITKKLKEMKIENFYDFTDIFDDQEKSIFFDECHVSSEANAIVADKISDIVKRDFNIYK